MNDLQSVVHHCKVILYANHTTFFFLLERTFRNIWKLDNTDHMSSTMANQWQIYVSFCLTTGYHIWRSFRGFQTIAHYVRSLFTTRSFFHFAKTVFVWFQSLVSWKKLCVLGNVFWSPVTMLSKQLSVFSLFVTWDLASFQCWTFIDSHGRYSWEIQRENKTNDIYKLLP